jgi:BMFP domain-containing protein YqiC
MAEKARAENERLEARIAALEAQIAESRATV